MKTRNSILLSKSIALVASEFIGKLDRGGQPYVLHCLHVMNRMPQGDHELMMIAVMHDLIEDRDVALDDLVVMGYSPRVVTALDMLTHRDGESYDKYINRVACNPDAVLVKLADLRHNSDIMRMKGLRQKDFERLEKYHRAYEYLNSLT